MSDAPTPRERADRATLAQREAADAVESAIAALTAAIARYAAACVVAAHANRDAMDAATVTPRKRKAFQEAPRP